VNSWPVGVAVSLLVLPLIGTGYGVGAVQLGVASLIGCGIMLLTIAYRPPAKSTVTSTTSLRLDRNAAIAVAWAGLFAILMVALPRGGAVVLTVVALGLISGLPAGPIMTLPARVLQPQTRAIGMGLFYTLYYAAMLLRPVIAGACAKWTGSAAAAFDFGALMILACPLILWGFNRIPVLVPKPA
jgi:hypothetical protein